MSKPGRADGRPGRAVAKSLELDDPPVTVRLRRSRAARRMSLSVSRIDGGAQLTVPRGCSERAALAFLREHGDWLKQTLASAPPRRRLELGAQIPYRGRLVTLRTADAPRLLRLRETEEGSELLIGGASERAGRRALAWLREEARAHLLARSEAHAEALKVNFSKVSIRDTRSRWGSCSSSGALSYNWRLILAPDDVLDYVAAHEVAHLLEMNHSSRFWAHVEARRPDWRVQRDWLRTNGAELHLYYA